MTYLENLSLLCNVCLCILCIVGISAILLCDFSLHLFLLLFFLVVVIGKTDLFIYLFLKREFYSRFILILEADLKESYHLFLITFVPDETCVGIRATHTMRSPISTLHWFLCLLLIRRLTLSILNNALTFTI